MQKVAIDVVVRSVLSSLKSDPAFRYQFVAGGALTAAGLFFVLFFVSGYTWSVVVAWIALLVGYFASRRGRQQEVTDD